VKNTYYLVILSALALLSACSEPEPMTQNSTPVDIEELLNGAIQWNLNPNGKTPLAGELNITTNDETDIEIFLKEDETVQFSSKNKKEHTFNIIGLFADATNNLNVSIRTTDSLFRATGNTILQTGPLPDFFPDIQILAAEATQMEKGWNFLELNIGTDDGFLFYPIVFDAMGRIRYYIDLSEIERWVGPIQFTENNTWRFGQFNYMDEFDILFNKVDDWNFGDYNVHHDFYQKENGNVLVCTSERSTATEQDRLIEYDPISKNIVNIWDFRDVLDVDRNEMNWNTSDWVHTNSVSYIESQNLSVMSGRYQGVFAIDDNQNLKWIMSPHKGWGKAGPNGDSFETSDYLLTAVNADNEPYNEDVQLGLVTPDDFSWTWGQHACQALDNGNIVCFDNGWKTNFDGNANFSRAVEYEIDPQAMTVKQVWEYGRERGIDLFSSNISDVDVLPETNNRLMIPGNVRLTDVRQARMVEIAYPTQDVVFEAVILFKNAMSVGGGWTQADMVYQGERIDFFK